MGSSFEPDYILNAQSAHTHTAIILHGRGSSGEEFAEEFMESTLSTGRSLRDELPSWRWVFPSSKELWSTAFQEDMPAWFEAHSLTDPTARQDLQVEGLRDSVEHVLLLIEEEAKRLDGHFERLVLGGISQGGAVALWALLCWRSSALRNLAALFATSTWLPFATEIEELLLGPKTSVQFDFSKQDEQAKDQLLKMVSPTDHHKPDSPHPTPVFLGHGADDAYVDIELGRQVLHVLDRGGWNVEWREYTGAEEEGHWFKVPDEMDDIFRFLTRTVRN
ncbi:hypothetical protein DV738_g2896, partial [Chaetothyriales sp. CBS 135597]